MPDSEVAKDQKAELLFKCLTSLFKNTRPLFVPSYVLGNCISAFEVSTCYLLIQQGFLPYAT